MKKFLATAAAAVAFASLSTSANALITVGDRIADDLHGTTLAAHGQVMLDNFDTTNNPRTSYVGNIIEYPLEFENPISTSAPPPFSGGIMVGGASVKVDNTNYASVQGGQTATYSILGGYTLRSFSFYMGSPDTYNHVTFFLQGGGSQVFDSTAIWGGSPPGDGDRSQGFRVYYNFNGAKVTAIQFASDTNAFEFDGLAGSIAVPEPATWALMIGGFGMTGAMLRRRRVAAA